MNILLEADYSSADSIIDGIKQGKIHIKNGAKLAEDNYFKFWLQGFVRKMINRQIPVSKVLLIALKKKPNQEQLNETEADALKYYVKYRQSPNFKDLINKLETTNMTLTEFHNEAQKMADNTKNGKRALRKAETSDEDIEVLYDKNGWKVTSPKTWQASVKAATFEFGKAPWCTASSRAEEFYNEYTDNGKYKLFIVNGGSKDKVLQAVFNPERPDVESFANDGNLPNFKNFPDEVLKVCKCGNKSLYDFIHLNDKFKNISKSKKDKNGWTSTTTLYPFGKDEFWKTFARYVDGTYDNYNTIKNQIKKDGIESYVKKQYTKGDRTVDQSTSTYNGKKIFDKGTKNKDDDFWGVLSMADYEKEKDLPRKVKSDMYQKVYKSQRKDEVRSIKDFGYETVNIKPGTKEYDKLFELGISKYGLKKGDEEIRLSAHYLAPNNTHERYPVIYVGKINAKIMTGNDKELFKYCMVHFFKKYIKDWKGRGNYLSDIIKGNSLSEWKKEVLKIIE